MRLRREKRVPKVLVVFARDKASYEEDFAGLALTWEQDSDVRKHIESERLECLTEEVALQGWSGTLDEIHFPDTVYLVFRGGRSQEARFDENDYEPEIIGAFVTLDQAELFAAKERNELGGQGLPLHVWGVKPGWFSRTLRWD